MAIELKLASYCQNCRNITPVAVKMPDNLGVFIECEDKNRCAFLARFISKQMRSTERQDSNEHGKLPPDPLVYPEFYSL